MANRTFKFYGAGYGPTPSNITVNFAGNSIFSGDIPTLNTSTMSLGDSVFLFEGGEVPVAFEGTVPMEITVNSGTAFFVTVESNYTITPNPVFTTEQYAQLIEPSTPVETQLSIVEPLATPSFSAEEIAFISNPTSDYTIVEDVLESHGVLPYVKNGAAVFTTGFTSGDCRSDVTINGEPQVVPVPRPDGKTGDWGWTVNQSSVFAYNLNILAGQE
jgi:hypothetical protein